MFRVALMVSLGLSYGAIEPVEASPGPLGGAQTVALINMADAPDPLGGCDNCPLRNKVSEAQAVDLSLGVVDLELAGLSRPLLHRRIHRLQRRLAVVEARRASDERWFVRYRAWRAWRYPILRRAPLRSILIPRRGCPGGNCGRF